MVRQGAATGESPSSQQEARFSLRSVCFRSNPSLGSYEVRELGLSGGV